MKSGVRQTFLFLVFFLDIHQILTQVYMYSHNVGHVKGGRKKREKSVEKKQRKDASHLAD